jgi:SAM-dependent methyltransferase
MNTGKSRNPWSRDEGDNWFRRNRAVIGRGYDPVTALLQVHAIAPHRVCEVGCSNGYRLAALHHAHGCEVIGVEPSSAAIRDGRRRWPFISFIRATADTFTLERPVDLVIVHFVLHWVPRELLFKTLERIDAALMPGGFLVIGDFGLEGFAKRRYHHRPKDDLWTYKQYYPAVFTVSGLYREIGLLRYNHDTHEPSADITTDSMGTVTLLRKQELYLELRG